MSPGFERGHRSGDGALDFWRHVADLRKALLWSVAGWLFATLLAWQYWRTLWGVLSRPLSTLEQAPKIIVTSPMGTVSMSFQVGLVAGSVLAAPWIFWQLWGFVRPALHQRERSIALVALGWSTLLFFAGMTVAYFTILPWTLRWLLTYGDGMFEQLWTVDAFTSMSMQLLGGFGAMFEFPLLTWVLARLGFVGPRHLWKWSRGAIVVIFVVAAVLTPPDPVSQCIMAVPMLGLYAAGIFTSWLAWKGGADGFDRLR
ncbi:MAG TPA: twin-arginine translocase subunit TatC [Fibrobacteria bacterium]|nr:twin-arginine translocase subunit TatC [Fibrobacteria bacterium]